MTGQSLEALEESGRKPRNAFMLMAECIGADGKKFPLRIRNLSETGMGAACAEISLPDVGQAITIQFKGIRNVTASVVWVQPKSFGATFDRLVDPVAIRAAAIVKPEVFEVRDLHKVPKPRFAVEVRGRR